MDPSHVLWIGGPDETRRATVARALADRFGSELYTLDEHADAHALRMTGALGWSSVSRHRLRLVLEDVRDLPGDHRLIVEGEELSPVSISAVVGAPNGALFLLTAADTELSRLIEREANDVRLPTLRADRPLPELVELAAQEIGRGDDYPDQEPE